MAQKPETRLVQATIKLLTADNQCNAFKLHGSAFQRAGEPDIIGATVAHIETPYYHIQLPLSFGFEAKLEGEAPRPLQEYRLEQWRLRGWVVGVIYLPQHAFEILDRHVRSLYPDGVITYGELVTPLGTSAASL